MSLFQLQTKKDEKITTTITKCSRAILDVADKTHTVCMMTRKNAFLVKQLKRLFDLQWQMQAMRMTCEENKITN